MKEYPQPTPPPAGQRVNLALAAAWVSGVRPAAITIELNNDGTPASLIIDARWGTTVQDARRVYEALGITNPAMVEWPESHGRTRVDIDDSDSFGDPYGRAGLPVSITVDGPTTHHTADQHAAGDRAEVIDLAAHRAQPAAQDTPAAGSNVDGRTADDLEHLTAVEPVPLAEDDDSWGL